MGPDYRGPHVIIYLVPFVFSPHEEKNLVEKPNWMLGVTEVTLIRMFP